MAVLKNRAKMSTSTTGTGTITLGSAESGYQTFADAGVANTDVVRYVIEDTGGAFEIGTGTYTSSGTTLSRTVSESSNSNNAINLSGSATVFIGATAEDIPALYAANESSPSAQPSATGTNAIAIADTAVSSALNSIAIGAQATAQGNRALALGWRSFASGNEAVAIAQDNSAVNGTVGATGGNSLAFGRNTLSSSSYSTALGSGSAGTGATTATGAGAMALGASYASGTDSFAAAITNNTSSYGASGANSIVMGRLSKTSGADGISIGDNNIVSNSKGIALGSSHSISGVSGYAIGTGHTVSGFGAACIGGSTSTATQTYAMTFGPYAKAAVQNAFIFGSKGWFSAGSAQGGVYILYADTTDATAEALTTTNSTAGNTNQIVAANDTCITFDGTITAMQNGAQAYASWKIEGLLVNDGGTTTLANSATTVIQNSSNWGMALSADNTNNALAITCTGEASHNIRWVANIRTTECTFA